MSLPENKFEQVSRDQYYQTSLAGRVASSDVQGGVSYHVIYPMMHFILPTLPTGETCLWIH